MARLVDKEKKYAQYAQDIEKATVAVVADYRGLTVEQLSVLRSALFKQQAKFTVVKNTIVKRAIKGTQHEAMESLFQGPMAVLYGFGDEVPPAKTLKEFFQKAKIGEIKGGLIGSQVLSKQEVLQLADLPPLEELRGKLLSCINSPLAGMVNVLSGPQRGLVTVLDQYAKMKEGASA